MLKQDIVDEVANRCGLTKKSAEEAVNAFIDSVTKALKNGETVLITGFGKFEVRMRSARVGRNPQTGAQLKIAETKTPAFRAGKALKAAVK